MMKFAGIIGAVLMVFSLSGAAAAAQSSDVEGDAFGEALNKCLSNPRVSLLDCARIAGREAESATVDVRYSLSLGAGPETGERDGTVEQCESDELVVLCDYYNCREEDEMSICDLVGICYSIADLPAQCAEI